MAHCSLVAVPDPKERLSDRIPPVVAHPRGVLPEQRTTHLGAAVLQGEIHVAGGRAAAALAAYAKAREHLVGELGTDPSPETVEISRLSGRQTTEVICVVWPLRGRSSCPEPTDQTGGAEAHAASRAR